MRSLSLSDEPDRSTFRRNFKHQLPFVCLQHGDIFTVTAFSVNACLFWHSADLPLKADVTNLSCICS